MPRLFPLSLLLALSLSALCTLAATPAPPATAPAAALTLTGKLATGVMAIGGETTGTTLTVGTSTYELDFKDPALKAKASQLSGQQVTVKGTLTLKAGIEIAQRRIITVDSLEPAATLPASTTRPN